MSAMKDDERRGTKLPRLPRMAVLPRMALRLAFFTLVVVGLAPEVLSEPNELIDFHDEFFFWSHEEAARRTILEYGEIPYWNPYLCGGVVGVANPQDTSLAPDFVLRLAFGTAPGRHLTVLLFFVLAMEGLYVLARRHGATRLGAVVGAIVFGVSGRLQNAFEHGHLNLLLFALVPWVLLFFERGMKERRFAVAGGFVVAWMILCGGTYTTPYTVQLLLLASVYWSFRIELVKEPMTRGLSGWSPWIALSLMGVVAFGLSAVRLLPMVDVVLGIPRELLGRQVETPGRVVSALFEVSGPGYQGDAYVGIPIGVLAALALLGRNRSGRWFAGAALFFALMALGEIFPWAPYSIFRKLPVFNQLRDPYRYVVLVSMFLCLAASRGLTSIEELPRDLLDRLRRRHNGVPFPPAILRAAWLLGLVLALGVVAYGSTELLASQRVREGSLFEEPGVSPSHQRFRQARGNRWDAQIWPSVNLGSLHCFEETKFRQAEGLRGDLRAEEYPLDPALASVTRRSWTPHSIALTVSASEPTRIVINQNYHASWRSSVGEVVDHEGLLAIDVPTGRHELTLRFRDNTAMVGLTVSILAWLALLVWLARAGVRRARQWRDTWRALPP